MSATAPRQRSCDDSPYDFQWDAVFGNRDLLRTGLKNTLWIAAVSMVLATVFGLLLAAAADVAARRRCAGSPRSTST